MITAITLKNFKGISNAVTIPLRPLTIMFGKNSAGKSTVVQALHYAREVLLYDNPNADRTTSGGASVDLGGFRSLVNDHDAEKSIVIRFDLDIGLWESLPKYENLDFLKHYAKLMSDAGIDDESKKHLESAVITSNILGGRDLSETFNDSIERGNHEINETAGQVSLEFEVRWSETLQKPVVSQYQTWIGGVAAGRIQTSLDEKNIIYEINVAHKFLVTQTENSFQNPPDADPVWQQVSIQWLGDGNYKSLPEWGKPLFLFPGNESENSEIGHQTVSQILVAPGDLVTRWLKEFRYIGPLRALPPRNFQPALTEEESDWANGLAAWRELYNDKSLAELLVSGEWLGYKLKTGYRFELKQFREIPLDSPLMFALENNTVFDDIADTGKEIRDYPIKNKLVLIEEKSNLEVAPHDIGVGISQVMPVIVAALVSNNRMVAVEQPELHLHPAMQAELGDLFIASALGETKNFFLIETHSEHLILRVLRRIREQFEGEKEDSTSPDITPADVQLIYIEPTKEGAIFYNLPVTEEGDFAENVPGGFFAERAKELF